MPRLFVYSTGTLEIFRPRFLMFFRLLGVKRGDGGRRGVLGQSCQTSQIPRLDHAYRPIRLRHFGSAAGELLHAGFGDPSLLPNLS